MQVADGGARCVAVCDCKFQFNPTGTAKFTRSCDIATAFLTRNSVPCTVVNTAAAGTPATVTMSLPYHIGNGWFGGLLPATVFAMSAAAGDIYYGLWYPIIISAMTLVIGMIFVRDTLGTDLNAED